MYRVIKVLNNNGVLVFDMDTNKEMIMLNNGIGFGKRPGERFEDAKDAKIYAMESQNRNKTAISIVNGIEPVFLEITAQIISEAEKKFDQVNHDILLPLADHIAFAVKRIQDNIELTNPLTSDIRALFPEEYQIAFTGKGIIEQATDCVISDDEVGYITLHIHSALSDENISQAINITKMVKWGVAEIEQELGITLDQDTLGYNRLMSHMRYMIARNQKGETVTLDMEDYVRDNFPRAYQLAEHICQHLALELGNPFRQQEIGFLGLHIQRVWMEH